MVSQVSKTSFLQKGLGVIYQFKVIITVISLEVFYERDSRLAVLQNLSLAMFRDSMKMLEKYRLEKEKFLIFHLEIESVPS